MKCNFAGKGKRDVCNINVNSATLFRMIKNNIIFVLFNTGEKQNGWKKTCLPTL